MVRIAGFANQTEDNMQDPQDMQLSNIVQTEDNMQDLQDMQWSNVVQTEDHCEEEAEDQSSPARQEYVEYEETEGKEELKEGKFLGARKKEGKNIWARKQEEKGHERKMNLLQDIPQNLEVGNFKPRVTIKGEKRFFYCNLCEVQLSSVETMTSHENGVPHSKKVKKEMEAWKGKVQAGLVSPDRPQPVFIKAIPIPPPVKAKILKRLHERIRDSEEPIIGLKYVTEFLAESDRDMEPSYECEACGNKGNSNSMLSHLNGMNHKRTVAARRDPRNADMAPGALKRFAVKYSENQANLSKLIKTVKSDEEFPWPAGKYPGLGPVQPPIKRRREGGLAVQSRLVKLPHPNSVARPQTEDEAEGMIEMGRKLFELVLESQYTSFNQAEKQQLKNTVMNAVMKGENHSNKK